MAWAIGVQFPTGTETIRRSSSVSRRLYCRIIFLFIGPFELFGGGGERGHSVKLKTRLNLVTRLRICGVILPLHLHILNLVIRRRREQLHGLAHARTSIDDTSLSLLFPSPRAFSWPQQQPSRPCRFIPGNEPAG
jgi:hypothetical protein